MENQKISFVFLALSILTPTADFITAGDKVIWNDKNIKQPTEEQIQEKVKELEAQALIDTKYDAIETHIYSFYPQKKQSQDEKYVSSYTTKLKAQGVVDLEVQVVAMVVAFFGGTSLNEVLVGVPNEQKYLFEKLVKVGVRTEWAELCVIEGKSSITEKREPVYAEFPELH